MRVFLDDRLVSSELFPPTSTVAQVIDTAKSDLAGDDSIIVSLRCNQKEIAPELLDAVLAEPADSFDRLDLISGSCRQVALDALRMVRMALEDTFTAVRQAAEEFTAGQASAGMAKLVDCLTAWSQVNDSLLQSGELLDVKLDAVDFGSIRLADALVDLTRKLDEIRAALDARDNVLLADILRYEMDESLETWKSLLDGYIRHIERLGAETLAASQE